jgi:archaellum component FlaF (FlaF/FlaG flagellin family)
MKKLFTLIIGLLALANGVKAAEATFTVVNNDSENWPQLALYSWDNSSGENVEAFGGWPGVVLFDGTTVTNNEQVSVAQNGNAFTVTIKDYVATMNLIVNNNGQGKQFDLTDFADGKSYEIAAPVTPTSYSAAMFFINDGWEAVALYNWGGKGEIYGGWPGVVIVDANGTLNPGGNDLVKVENAGTTAEGYPIYKIGLGDDSGYENLIFNNNNGGLQFDVAFEDGAYYNTSGRTVAPDVPVETVSFTVVNNSPETWPQLALYNWGSSTGETLGGWPGTMLFDGTTPTDNEKVSVVKDGNTYTITLKVAYENLILNNTNGGDGNQFDLEDFADGKTYTIETSTTAINSITMPVGANGVRYNLNGQRVGVGYKGLVIIEGKKMILK